MRLALSRDGNEGAQVTLKPGGQGLLVAFCGDLFYGRNMTIF